MLDEEQARALAEKEIPKIRKDFGKEDITLSEGSSSKRERGWTFSYQNGAFRQSRHPKDGLLGNGPIFVDKFTSQVFRLPSGGWPSMLDEYDRTGNMPPVGRAGHRLTPISQK